MCEHSELSSAGFAVFLLELAAESRLCPSLPAAWRQIGSLLSQVCVCVSRLEGAEGARARAGEIFNGDGSKGRQPASQRQVSGAGGVSLRAFLALSLQPARLELSIQV